MNAFKKFCTILLLMISLSGFAQRYKSFESDIQFFSNAPLEDIKAENESASSIIDLETRSMVIVVPIKSFSFKKKLMQEHFNENYLESDDYPNATFKGKIVEWFGEEGTGKAVARGTMDMHGVTNEMEIVGDLTYAPDLIKAETKFTIKPADFKIKIPKAVFYKIAEEVEVTSVISYKPYEQN